MIRVLGARRVFVLFVLVLVNAALAAIAYAYIFPEKLTKDRELRRERGEISRLNADIDNLQLELEQLHEQQSQFETLKDKGFFGDLNPIQAERTFEKIQQEAEVISAVASIKPRAIEDNEEAQRAGYTLAKSAISLTIQSLDDIGVFRYIYLVEEYFPGHVSIESLELSREAEVTGVVLRGIAGGSNPPLVKANVEMTWRTLVKDETAPRADEQTGERGGRRR